MPFQLLRRKKVFLKSDRPPRPTTLFLAALAALYLTLYIYNHREPTYNHGEPTYNHREPTYNRREPTYNRGEPLTATLEITDE